MTDQQTEQGATEPQEADEAQTPVIGDQGEQVAPSASAVGFDPNVPRAISAPPASAQSGVPQIPDGSNEGVQPGDEETTTEAQPEPAPAEPTPDSEPAPSEPEPASGEPTP